MLSEMEGLMETKVMELRKAEVVERLDEAYKEHMNLDKNIILILTEMFNILREKNMRLQHNLNEQKKNFERYLSKYDEAETDDEIYYSDDENLEVQIEATKESPLKNENLEDELEALVIVEKVLNCSAKENSLKIEQLTEKLEALDVKKDSLEGERKLVKKVQENLEIDSTVIQDEESYSRRSKERGV